MPASARLPGTRPQNSIAARSLVAASALVAAVLGCRVDRPAHMTGPGRAVGGAGRSGVSSAMPGGAAAEPGVAAPAAVAEFPNIVVERNVPVPMRDGVVLRADIYRPEVPGRFPTLVLRTPYGKDGLLESGEEPTLSRAPRA